MIRNWKLTAHLGSPLCGEPPKLDAILIWELSVRLGMKHAKKLTRDTPLAEIDPVPIPVAQRTVNGVDMFCVSDPIMGNVIDEWNDYSNKRIDTHEIALMLAPEQRKNLLIASGPYKMRHVPLRIRLVPGVTWFIRCARNETNKLLKGVQSLGSRRGTGYGLIESWEWQEIEEDYSISAMQHGKSVLMRTVPFGPDIADFTGYRRGYAGAFPPYWHPETFREVAIPC